MSQIICQLEYSAYFSKLLKIQRGSVFTGTVNLWIRESLRARVWLMAFFRIWLADKDLA